MSPSEERNTQKSTAFQGDKLVSTNFKECKKWANYAIQHNHRMFQVKYGILKLKMILC